MFSIVKYVWALRCIPLIPLNVFRKVCALKEMFVRGCMSSWLGWGCGQLIYTIRLRLPSLSSFDEDKVNEP